MTNNYTMEQQTEGCKTFLKQYDKFYKHDIHVNLCNVTIGNNSKNQFQTSRFYIDSNGIKKTGCYKKRDQYSYKKTREYIIDNNICGGYIPMYPLNDLCCIDNDDVKKKKIYDLDLQQNIHNLTDNCKKNAIQYTPSGGSHTIFKHSDGIEFDIEFNGCIDRLSYNKDISKTTPCIFTGIRMDGIYSYNNKKPLELNDKLLAIMKMKKNEVKNYYTYNPQIVDKPNDKQYEYDKSFKYHITDLDFTKIFELLNTSKYYSSKTWFSITNIMKQYENDIPNSKEIWDNWSKSSDKYNSHKNRVIWDKMTEPQYDINYLIVLYNIEGFKKEPKVKERLIKRTIPYVPLDISLHTPELINTRFCSGENHNIYNGNDECISNVAKAPLGSGKSTAAFKFIEDNPHLNLITINRSICLNTQHKNSLEESYGKECVFTINSDKENQGELTRFINFINVNYDPNTTHIKSEYDEMGYDITPFKFDNEKRFYLSICLNSLVKLQKYLTKDFLKQTVVFLDEFHSTIQYLYTSTTLKGYRIAVLRPFKFILNNCNRFLACDGNITDIEIEFLNSMNLNYKFIINTYEPFKDIPFYMLEWKKFQEKLYQCIDNNETVCIPSNVAEKFKSLEIDITKKYIDTGILSKEQVLFIYDGATDIFISDQLLSKLKFFCYSPKIICGIDYKYEAKVFNIVCNSRFGAHLTCESILQQQKRCRKPIEINLYLRHEFDIPLYTSDFMKFNNHQFDKFINTPEQCEIFKEICEVDRKYNYNETIDSIIFNKIKFNDNIQKSDFENILLLMMNETGYKLIEPNLIGNSRTFEIIDDKSIEDMKKLSLDIRHSIFDDYIMNNSIEHINFKEYIDKLFTDIFNITNENVKTLYDKDKKLYSYFANLICDKKQLDQYFFLNNLQRNMSELKARASTNNKDELKIIKSQSIENKILIITGFIHKYIPGVLGPNLDFSTFYYNEESYIDKNIFVSKYDYDYLKIVTETKTNKKHPTTEKECIDLIYVILNKYIPSYIHNVSKSTKINKKVVKMKTLSIINLENKMNISNFNSYLKDYKEDDDYNDEDEFIKNYWKKIHHIECDDFDENELINYENIVNVCDILKMIIDDVVK